MSDANYKLTPERSLFIDVPAPGVAPGSKDPHDLVTLGRVVWVEDAPQFLSMSEIALSIGDARVILDVLVRCQSREAFDELTGEARLRRLK